jgi:hypothetical protein
MITPDSRDLLRGKHETSEPVPRDLPLGAFLGAVRLVHAHHTEPGCCASRWAMPEALVHLELADPKPFPEPVFGKGRLGFWRPEIPLPWRPGALALSIRQPWAHAVLHLGKDVENRDWRYPPTHRGAVIVHAGLARESRGADLMIAEVLR